MKKFVLVSTISILFVSTVLSANTEKCIGGVCLVNLDNLQPSRAFKKKKEQLVVLETPRYIEDVNIQDNFIDRSMTIILDGETITVFPKSSYRLSEIDTTYYEDSELNQDGLLVIKPLDEVTNEILHQDSLPNSEFFCEKNTKILYDKRNDTFQCV